MGLVPLLCFSYWILGSGYLDWPHARCTHEARRLISKSSWCRYFDDSTFTVIVYLEALSESIFSSLRCLLPLYYSQGSKHLTVPFLALALAYASWCGRQRSRPRRPLLMARGSRFDSIARILSLGIPNIYPTKISKLSLGDPLKLYFSSLTLWEWSDMFGVSSTSCCTAISAKSPSSLLQDGLHTPFHEGSLFQTGCQGLRWRNSNLGMFFCSPNCELKTLPDWFWHKLRIWPKITVLDS